ncbi:putative LRR receptor-like serine/threonine-protein kinase [Platanthera guangdongensis]|uniref:LRR receptor-like serine/threonine-protein kinase n=1 Tax=Platanthera guangdongensis TaxID=2320717 RepID=A0ABR2N5D8_9ASPA
MGISHSVVSRRKVITFPPAEGGGRRRRLGRWRRGRNPGGRENNSWLLAEAGGEPSEAEPQSVHSSFRFSFGSQAEAEAEAEADLPPVTAATVLLLLSVEDEEDVAEPERRKLDSKVPVVEYPQQWRRMESLERSIAPAAGGLMRFSYSQIRSATRDFSIGKQGSSIPKNCSSGDALMNTKTVSAGAGRELGRGALSRVYKGRMGRGLRRPAVAVKRVDGPERESAKAFCRELLIASSLCSPHVVPLLGYCIEKEGLFLVYKYISGGSLDRHLHQKEKGRKALPWAVRYKVAVGTAQAVEYLHYSAAKCIVHRDVKPSNILLSAKRNPMIERAFATVLGCGAVEDQRTGQKARRQIAIKKNRSGKDRDCRNPGFIHGIGIDCWRRWLLRFLHGIEKRSLEKIDFCTGSGSIAVAEDWEDGW